MELANAINELNNANFEKEIGSLKSKWSKKGKTAAIFDLKERVIGSKKSGMETVAVVHPETGILVTSPKAIKKVSLDYCVKLLTNREPKDSFKKILETKESLHQERMREEVEDDLGELTIIEFNNALKKVSSTHREKYKFILNSGASLLKAIFKLFSLVWRKEEIPRSWSDSELIQVYKAKEVKVISIMSDIFI